MPGGLLQLSAYGSENQYLNGNPQITFFKSVYKRYTNFSMESIEVNLQGSNDLSFDKSIKLKAKIPRNADLLANMYLKLKLPNIFSDDQKQFYWIEKLGLNIIDYCEIFIGGSRIERLDGQFLDLYYQLLLDKKKKGFKNMIGDDHLLSYNALYNSNIYPGHDQFEYVDENTSGQGKKYINKYFNSSPSIFDRYLNIPLPFWFSKNFGLSVPLIALQYHDLEIEIQLKPAKDLYTILKKDKTYYYYNNNSHYHSKRPVNSKFKNEPYNARKNAAENGELSVFSQSYRKKPDTLNQEEHISQFINGSYNPNTWDLNPTLDINYIFLDTDERKVFAEITHEYLIEQVIKIDKTGIQGSNIIELEAFHPIKEIIFVANRDDNNLRNEWSNYTTSPTSSNSNYSIYDYQDYWWKNSVSIATKNPITFTHQNPHNIAEGDPEYPIVIGIGSEKNIVCDRFQEFLFRYGPFGEAGDDAPNASESILQFTKLPNHNLYSINDFIQFRKSWPFNKSAEIPCIDNTNYEIYRNNPLIDCKLKFNGQSRLEKHRHEYFRYVQPYQHHSSIPDQPIYSYSFSLKPEDYQPSGACNFSRLKNIEFEINLKETPRASIQIPGSTTTRDWLYDMHFYLINYNVLKIASGLGGIAFGN